MAAFAGFTPEKFATKSTPSKTPISNATSNKSGTNTESSNRIIYTSSKSDREALENEIKCQHLDYDDEHATASPDDIFMHEDEGGGMLHPVTRESDEEMLLSSFREFFSRSSNRLESIEQLEDLMMEEVSVCFESHSSLFS